MQRRMTIGEVARRAGVRPSAIRYYERMELLPKPERVGGKRCYGEEVLHRLALVGGAKRAGFTLGEIHTLLQGFPVDTAYAVRWRALASDKLVEVEETMARLRQSRELLWEALRCRCASFDECATLLADA